MESGADVLAGAVASLLTGVSYFMRNKIKGLFKKNKLKQLNTLLFHDMFITIENVSGRVKKIKFITKGKVDAVKTALLRILIDLKIKSVKKAFSELIKDKDLPEASGQKLKFMVSGTLIGLVEEYNNQALLQFVELGISKKDAKFLIDKYEEHRQYIVEGFLERLDSICMNKGYSCNYEKMNAILEVVALALHVIPRDVKHAMDSVNGRYVKYDNKINWI